MISYEDGIGALEWLASAFGFRETARLMAPDGRLSHGEMRAGDGLIMLASPTPDYRSPKRHRETCEQARRWSTVPWVIDGVLVFVDHLDRHLARARAAGATILSEIEEGPPGRRYRAEDLEGHRWFFFEKDVNATVPDIKNRRRVPRAGDRSARDPHPRGPLTRS
jgi:PhnB protein